MTSTFKTVKEHKGDILVGVLGKNDIFYFKVSKKETLSMIISLGTIFDEMFSISKINGTLCIDNAS